MPPVTLRMRPLRFDAGRAHASAIMESASALQVAQPPRSAYAKWGKRLLDVVAASLGLLVLSPLFVILCCVIKVTSRGGPFYRQARIGKDGRRFLIVKFRSMIVGHVNGLEITVSGDRRVTSVGRILRRYKLDELPQLWNVLRGDMSLVGPRPELPVYVAAYTEQQRQVLAVRPGVTDPASLAYRHEEAILAEHKDPEQFYRTQVLPDKLARNLAYVQAISLKNDLHVIFETVVSSFLASQKAHVHRDV